MRMGSFLTTTMTSRGRLTLLRRRRGMKPREPVSSSEDTGMEDDEHDSV
jgi:hypothetical protein